MRTFRLRLLVVVLALVAICVLSYLTRHEPICANTEAWMPTPCPNEPGGQLVVERKSYGG
jgi:hypothetical protein